MLEIMVGNLQRIIWVYSMSKNKQKIGYYWVSSTFDIIFCLRV